MITAKDPDNLKWVVKFNHLTDRQEAVVKVYNEILDLIKNTPNDQKLGSLIRQKFS